MNETLRLTGIRKGYHLGKPSEIRVLNGVDLTLNAGEVVALVAPSGAGKSTLLHIAGLLDTPDDGAVTMGGTDLTGASDRLRTRARRDRIGFIYQFHHLLPEFTAAENIILPQLANGVSARAARSRAEDLLGRVGLSHRADHRPAEMSGGEQQRTAFCRALANGPGLLLADEPTGNLDTHTAAEVFELMRRFGREAGCAVLLVTHDPRLSAACDRTIDLVDGRIVSDTNSAA